MCRPIDVELMIQRMIEKLRKKQAVDGSWCFCFETGTMPHSYMIILMNMLGRGNEAWLEPLAEYVLSLQQENGAWKLYQDEEEGNLSATIENCVSLLYGGFISASDPRMARAKDWIEKVIHKKRINSVTQVWLTLLGHREWSHFPKVPMELFLVPKEFPVSFYHFVGYARVHIGPIMMLRSQRFQVLLPRKREVEKWLPTLFPEGSTRSIEIRSKEAWLKSQVVFRTSKRLLKRLSLRRAEKFLLRRIEPDGTLYSYFSSTFWMIVAFLSIGYSKSHPIIVKAIKGLKKMIVPAHVGNHLQETTSTVWDTSLLLYALQEAGVRHNDPMIQKGVSYILSRQQTQKGDWGWNNPHVLPGGWGFSDINTINPDVDDTSAALRTLAPTVASEGLYQKEWIRGVDWLVSMQNQDGGWPAFEKNTNASWFRFLPYRDGRMIWGDPSSADLTGRTLHFLGSVLGWKKGHPVCQKAITWLFKQQESDGSWFGRWGICYLYGTWATLTGCSAVGIKADTPEIDKAVKWIISKQNEDGGWGESCLSDEAGKYIPLNSSTPSQTAWALDALMAYAEKPTPEIESGMHCLVDMMKHKNWTYSYPTGAGWAGQFYMNYHSYQYIWPLLTLAHYHKKFT